MNISTGFKCDIWEFTVFCVLWGPKPDQKRPCFWFLCLKYQVFWAEVVKNHCLHGCQSLQSNISGIYTGFKCDILALHCSLCALGSPIKAKKGHFCFFLPKISGFWAKDVKDHCSMADKASRQRFWVNIQESSVKFWHFAIVCVLWGPQ